LNIATPEKALNKTNLFFLFSYSMCSGWRGNKQGVCGWLQIHYVTPRFVNDAMVLGYFCSYLRDGSLEFRR